MPKNLTDYEENRLLDLSWLTTDKLCLMEVLGTDSASGTEVAGGTYTRQVTADLAAAAGGQKTTTAPIQFDDLPDTDVQGWSIRDSAGTNRKWFGLWAQLLGSASASTDKITSTAHGHADGDKIVFLSGYAPTGLSANTTYYVRDAATNDFKVAATLGGSAIDITADAATVAFGSVVHVTTGGSLLIGTAELTVSLD